MVTHQRRCRRGRVSPSYIGQQHVAPRQMPIDVMPPPLTERSPVRAVEKFRRQVCGRQIPAGRDRDGRPPHAARGIVAGAVKREESNGTGAPAPTYDAVARRLTQRPQHRDCSPHRANGRRPPRAAVRHPPARENAPAYRPGQSDMWLRSHPRSRWRHSGRGAASLQSQVGRAGKSRRARRSPDT